jgi:hypothetical protein
MNTAQGQKVSPSRRWRTKCLVLCVYQLTEAGSGKKEEPRDGCAAPCASVQCRTSARAEVQFTLCTRHSIWNLEAQKRHILHIIPRFDTLYQRHSWKIVCLFNGRDDKRLKGQSNTDWNSLNLVKPSWCGL